MSKAKYTRLRMIIIFAMWKSLKRKLKISKTQISKNKMHIIVYFGQLQTPVSNQNLNLS